MFDQAELRAFLCLGEENGLRIDGGEVEAVPIAVVVALAGKELLMVGGVAVVENEIDLEMEMGAVFGNSFARVCAAAHGGDDLPLFDGLADDETIGNIGEMRVNSDKLHAF